MEDDLYSSSHNFHSICPDNSDNAYNMKEEVNSSNRKISKNVKLEYMQYNNYNDLSQNSESLNTTDNDVKNVNIYAVDNSFGNCSSPKTSKESVTVNYNRQVDIASSRRRQTFKCQYCPKVFCNSSAIAKHKLTHSDERKYVCDICGKAFKRQDHLNGHKHTHKVNKPHACHFCERSYSDARSLKRHYENQHQKEYKEKMATRDSGSSVDDNGPPVIDAFGFFEDHKSVKCEVCSRGFKNQSALNGHMRLHGGYGPTKNGITGPGEAKLNISMPENVSEKNLPISTEKQMISTLNRGNQSIIIVTSRQETNSLISLPLSSSKTSVNFSNHCNSSSVRLLDSHHFTNSPKYIQSLSPGTHITDSSNLPNVSIEDLRLVLQPISIREHNPCSLSSTSDKSPSPIEISTDGIGYSQSTTKQSSSTTDLPQSQYSPITPAYLTKNVNININLHDQNIFTYPSLLDSQQITNLNESNISFDNNHPDDYLMNYDKFNTGFVSTNQNAINKSWQYCDLSINSQETPEYNNSNPPSLKKISSANNIQDILMNLDNLSDSNDVISNSVPSIIEDSAWSQYRIDNPNINFSNSSCKIPKLESSILTTIESGICPSPMLSEGTGNNTVLKPIIPEAQPIIPNRKPKTRPGPIFIPPQTSAHMSRLRSPRVWNTSESSEQKIPPYTPPPMLSPQRRGSGLFHTVRNSSMKNSANSANSFCSWNTPFSTKTVTAVSNNYCSDSIVSSLGGQQMSTVLIQDSSDEKNGTFERTIEPQHFLYQDDIIDVKAHSFEDKDGLPTSATPRINIGPEYQADLTNFSPDTKPKGYKRTYDALLWDPKHFNETVENNSSLELLMKIASSPAVKSCGLNMEYTFHLLFKYQGDLEKTLQALLEESFVVYDYVYAETSNWTTEEIGQFQERLKTRDRDFMRVSLDLQSCGINKSVKACVEFYYVWKHMNNTKDVNIYRIKSKKRLATRNSTPQHEDDNYARGADSYSNAQLIPEPPYNLRNYKCNSENQKVTKQLYYYGSKTSSCSSSREPSPAYSTFPMNLSALTQDTVKKPRLSYPCSHCNKTFAKLKTLENHTRIHNKTSRIKTQNRNIERCPEANRYS